MAALFHVAPASQQASKVNSQLPSAGEELRLRKITCPEATPLEFEPGLIPKQLPTIHCSIEGALTSCRQDIPEFGVCQVNEAFTHTCAFPYTGYFYTRLECPLFHIPSAP